MCFANEMIIDDDHELMTIKHYQSVQVSTLQIT